MLKKKNLREVIERINQPWAPEVLELFDGFAVRLARYEGSFPWHKHDDEDEFFLVVQGTYILETDEGKVMLDEGECALVKKGVRHRPIAEKPAYVLMVEKQSIKHEGN